MNYQCGDMFVHKEDEHQKAVIRYVSMFFDQLGRKMYVVSIQKNGIEIYNTTDYYETKTFSSMDKEWLSLSPKEVLVI